MSGEPAGKILIWGDAAERAFPVAAHRIDYMKLTRHRRRTMVQRWRVCRARRQDRRAGSYFADADTSVSPWLTEMTPPRWLHREMTLHPEPPYDVTGREGFDKHPDEPAVLIPLHMEPEATLLMHCPWFQDQIEGVRLVSQILPAGWRVWVKENPKMLGIRSLSWNRKAASFLNVAMMSPTVPSELMIRRLSAVFSIAGTASLEARLMGKPGYCMRLGDTAEVRT